MKPGHLILFVCFCVCMFVSPFAASKSHVDYIVSVAVNCISRAIVVFLALFYLFFLHEYSC